MQIMAVRISAIATLDTPLVSVWLGAVSGQGLTDLTDALYNFLINQTSPTQINIEQFICHFSIRIAGQFTQVPSHYRHNVVETLLLTSVSDGIAGGKP